jgi:hypothetical protein
MNPAPFQAHLLKMGELLHALRSEQLSPEADVLRREAQASVYVISRHVIDLAINDIFKEPPVRDRAKGES